LPSRFSPVLHSPPSLCSRRIIVPNRSVPFGSLFRVPLGTSFTMRLVPISVKGKMPRFNRFTLTESDLFSCAYVWGPVQKL
jgi:hypothetical protein